MMMKTHLVIGAALALVLINNVNYKFLFLPIILIASILPDIDVPNSRIGNRWYFRPIQLFVNHRGIIHSFSLCVALSILVALVFPVAALPFFAGYSVHLFADSFTVEGIKPFWPLGTEVKGSVRVGGKMEEGIFAIFAIADVILLIGMFI